jgi:hypothetical protein
MYEIEIGDLKCLTTNVRPYRNIKYRVPCNRMSIASLRALGITFSRKVIMNMHPICNGL